MIERKFGPLAAAQQQQLDAADQADLDRYAERLFDAASLDELLRR